MKTYSAIYTAFNGSIWAIAPEKLQAIAEFLDAKFAGLSIDGKLVEKVAGENRNRTAAIKSSVAVIPVVGTITQRADLMSDFSGGVSTERLGRDIEAMVKDSEVGSIVLDIDSPGGNYTGTPELAEKIYNLRGSKPIVAVANGMAASAAYWIGTAADELVVTPSGEVGSVGVLAVHYDQSQLNADMGIKVSYVTSVPYKAEFNQDEPLTDMARGELQKQVDEAYGVFVNALAKQRKTSAKNVRENYGLGRMFSAAGAVERGMADRVGTLEAEISRLASGIKPKRRGHSVEKARLDFS